MTQILDPDMQDDWDEMEAENEALLRVARAAKDVADDAYYSEEGGPHCLVDAPFIYDLEEALKEVEHLLG